MLIIDGAKYEEWIPEKEVEEFQPIIKEHVQDIFGNKSKYIEARRLKSEAGIGSVPDGFVIIFGDPPKWHIVEVELSSHQLYDHIVNQVGRFINGIKNPVTQKNIIDAMYQEITGSKISKVEVEEAIGSGEIHKFLTDIISLPPILTIIIEKKTQELEEAINLLKYSPIKIVEFQTFTREGTELAVHAHLFEPLCETSKGGEKPFGEAGRGETPLPKTSELLATYGNRLSNVVAMTWQQLYNSNTDGNFRYFKVRIPLIELYKKETQQ